MNKPLKVALVAFIVGLTMLVHTPSAYAETAFTTVTCATPQGEQVTRQIGWDNSNRYFADKGNIAQHYCEGGFAGPYTIYIGDTLPVDSPLRYYAGIVPTPTPSPSQTTTIEPTPLPSEPPPVNPTPIPEPVVTPSDTPMPEPTPTPSPSDAPVPDPVVTNEPTPAPVEPTALPLEPSPTPTPTPEPEPTPVQIVETPEPTAEPSPTPIPSIEPIPIPSLDPQEVTLEVPTQLLAIPGFEELAKSVEAIMNIGSDMTPEQREESQSVVIGAVLVGQIATSIRRIK